MRVDKKFILILILILIPLRGRAIENGWMENDGNLYYYVDGNVQKGIIQIDNYDYLFGYVSGKLYQNGLATTPDGRVYLTDNDGKIQYGFQKYQREIYYFDKNGMYKGILELEDGDYLFGYVSGKLYRNGLATTPDGRAYLTDKDGKIQYGFQKYQRETYYFDKNGMYKGILETEEGDYLFGYVSGKLYRDGLATTPDGRVYLTDNDGKIQYGFQKYQRETYYFDKNGMYKGILETEEGDYLFGYVSGKLYRNGLATTPDGRVYLTDNDGKIQYGFQEYQRETYYFDKNGMYKGILETEEGNYLFGYVSGKLYRDGWAKIPDGNIYYTNEQGIIQTGHLIINNIDYDFSVDGKLIVGWQNYHDKTYYIEFGNYDRVKGFKKIDDDVYYFDLITSEKVDGTKNINGNTFIFDDDGKLIKSKYHLSVYYSQKDKRWSENQYGLSNISKTGCAPTSMAMAFTSILGYEVLPTDVASYLYYHTNEYNRKTKGSSGLAIVFATDHFHIKRTALTSKEELERALRDGKIVFAAMGNGDFGTKAWNHAIVMAGYQDNKTYVQDPLSSSKNKWYYINSLWNQQSKDPDDYSGGSNFYSLEMDF